MSQEKFTSQETSETNKDNKEKTQKTFDPIEQRLEGCIALASKEYKEKFGNELPQKFKTPLIQMLTGKNENERDEILDDVCDIIENSDNPEGELDEYFKEFGTNEAKLERKANTHDLKINTTHLKNSVSNLKLNGKDPKYVSIIQRIQNLKFNIEGTQEEDTALKAEIDSILSDLKQAPDTLQAISLDLQAQSPQAYEAFRTSLISLDSDFRILLPIADAKAKLALGSDNLKGATISNGKISQNSKDGFTTTAKLDGTERTLGRSDSKFKLKSTLESDQLVQGEADRISTQANEHLKPLNNILQNLNIIKSYLEAAIAQKADIKDVKENIKSFSPDLYNQLGIEYLNSSSDIQTSLNDYIAKISAQRDKIEEKMYTDLDNLTKKHKQDLNEKQEIQKRVLDFLHVIGFDRIPQSVLNMIIVKINDNPAIYGLKRAIELENGILGFDSDELTDENKIKFIEISNTIISGDLTYPAKYGNGNITFHTSAENSKNYIPANNLFSIQEFVNKKLGTDPSYTAMKNISNLINNQANR